MRKLIDRLKNKSKFDDLTLDSFSNFLKKNNNVSRFLNLSLNSLYWVYKRKHSAEKKERIEVDPTDYFVKQISKLEIKKLRINNRKNEIETALELLERKDLEVASFDIFDTLLKRDVCDPSDIFIILAQKVKKEFNISNFYEIRKNAERLMPYSPERNLYHIYNFISRIYRIEMAVCSQIMNWEEQIEIDLLSRNELIYPIYKKAIEKGLKIIAISDMYLSSAVIRKALNKNGLNEITKIFVSNEIGKRKDKGDIYEFVINELEIEKKNIIHFGDNYKSDFVIPLKQGIPSYFIKNNIDYLKEENSIWKDALSLLDKNLTNDQEALFKIIFGFFLQKNIDELVNSGTSAYFENLKHLSDFLISPFLIYVSYLILNKPQSGEGHKKIYFASRDGYLPSKIFEIIREKSDPEVVYFYAGRTFYEFGAAESLEEFVLKYPDIQLKTFLENFIHEDELRLKLFKENENLLDKSLSNLFSENRAELFHSLEEYRIKYRNYLSNYYNSVFTTREVEVFDIGYSGSISRSISKVSDFIPNKIYLWETKANQLQDNKNNTKTWSLFGNLSLAKLGGLHLVLEELSSPLNPRVLGIKNELLEMRMVNEDHSTLMIRDVSLIHECLTKNAETISNKLGKYLREFTTNCSLTKPQNAINLLIKILFNSPFAESTLLKNVVFDDFVCAERKTLTRKLRDFNGSPYINQLSSLGLLNPNFLATNVIDNLGDTFASHRKIGLHLHLYYIEAGLDYVSILRKLPKSIDIFVTYPKGTNVAGIKSIFESSLKNNFSWIEAQNRGRDVGPWLIELKDIQKEYDLFGHFHTKKSPQMSSSSAEHWKNDLLRQLLSPQSFRNIFNFFEKNIDAGIALPYPNIDILQIWLNKNIPVMGSNQDSIDYLVKEIFKDDILTFERSDLVFSVGTMFWYKPKALNRLISYPFDYTQFPEEPIGLDGTLAHAIERIVGYVVIREGFKPYIADWENIYEIENN